MQTLQKITQRKHLQHLITAHWTCSQQQLLVLGMKMEIIYIHPSILQVWSLFF